MTDQPVAIITGASRGIGNATARRLAAAGYRVTLCARNTHQIGELAAEIGLAHCLPLACDVRDAKQVQLAVDATLSQWGRIDVLVNNAGLGIFGEIKDYSEEDWDLLFDTNVKGVFLFSRAVIPTMQQQGSGAIMMISSAAGRFTNPNLATYAATKHALTGFAGCLGLELRQDGIQVTLIEPGSVNTHFHNPHDAEGEDLSHKWYALEPEQVAQAILDAITLGENVWVREMLITPRRTQRSAK